MKDQRKTETQLLEELSEMRRRMDELETSEAKMKHEQERLLEIEEMFRLFLEHSPYYVFFKDEQIRATHLSKNFEKMLGRPLHDLIGKSMEDLFPSGLAKTMVQDDLRILREGQPIEVEEELAGRYYTTTKFPIIREGKPPMLAGFTVEITERKRAEEALRKEKEKCQKYLDIADIILLVIGVDERITLLNKRGCEILGYEEEEIIGKNWFDLSLPETEKQTVRQVFEKLMAGDLEPAGRFENLVLTKGGEERIIKWHNTLLTDDHGNRIGTLSSGEDVTEQRRMEESLRMSEEKFRDLYDHAPVGYLEYDSLGRISNVNRTILEMLGYSDQEMIGKPVWKFTVHEELARERILSKLAGTHPPERNLERAYRRSDGSILPVLIEDRLILGDRGRIKGLRSTIQDIARLKETEAEKALLQEQLHESQKMEAIGTLAGGIAHDFNNILSVVLGYAELAQFDMEENSKARQNLQQSMKAVHRAKDLVQQILAFSRQGKQERRPIDPEPVLEEGLKFIRASLPSTIEIRQEIETNSGVIEADPTQVHQVLMNLCSNAAHAMEENGGILHVSLRKVDVDRDTFNPSQGIQPGPYFRLRVSDTGHGMSPETMKRIFEPYFTTKETGKGTGLGLAVVHGIVKSYGGGISVASELGKGSTFDIYFPRAKGCAVRSRSLEDEPLTLGHRERILFVDDEDAIVEIGRTMLGLLGYEVVGKTSSIEALELFLAQPDRFDLVITDMTMPNMTGDKLAQELMKIRPGMPVILCTGFSEHITEEKAKTMGITEYVLKPPDMSDLAKAIRRALEPKEKKRG